MTSLTAPVALLICDVQERFRTTIFAFDELILTANKLLQAAELLQWPVFLTEQYPTALGSTVSELAIPRSCQPLAKTQFSMVIPELAVQLKQAQIKSCILIGIESHVCISQTAIDLLKKGYQVYIPVDGVSSARSTEVRIALDRLRHLGVQITSSDSLLFECLGDAQHEKFKAVSKLVKDHLNQTVSNTLMNLYHHSRM